ncbi:hypothetical protein Golob_023169, partial [Gossypium lobatum]|nr:hypothetical protein [Gossypium lobatum]
PSVPSVVLDFNANLKFSNDDKVYVKGKEKKQICVGTWIYKFMVRCVIRNETGVFFPHLVTDLCRAAKVPMKPLEPFHRPTTHVIGNSIYKKFKALQQEQHDK